MKLLLWGKTQIDQKWRVQQATPSGYVRCYYIVEGQVQYQQGQTVQMLQTGSLYLLPTTAPYSLAPVEGMPLKIAWFHFDLAPYLVHELQEMHQTPSEESQVMHTLNMLSQELRRMPVDISAREMLLSLLEIFLIREQMLQTAPAPFDEVLAYIHREISNPLLSVSLLSEQLACTPEHFIRRFSKAIGTTPYRYILMQRMAQARVLLLQKKSIKEIAKQTGYENARVFSFAFRNYFGVAPSQFELYYQSVL